MIKENKGSEGLEIILEFYNGLTHQRCLGEVPLYIPEVEVEEGSDGGLTGTS